MTTPPPLVLASSSPRRRELLQAIGLPFIVHPPSLDEGRPERFDSRDAIRRWVAETAAAKAAEVAASYGPERWILGADTIVVLDREILHKPRDEAEAVAMLDRLQGRTHTVMTAVALHRGGAEPGPREVVETEVTFYAATRAELEAYVAAGESLDKAGAYAAQGRGALIIERIEGCYFNVVGLPVASVARMLRGVGLEVWRANGVAGGRGAST